MATNRRLKSNLLSIGLALLLGLLGNLAGGVQLDSVEFLDRCLRSSLYIISLWYAMVAIRHWTFKNWKSAVIILLFVSFYAYVFFNYGAVTERPFNWIMVIRLLFSSMIIYIIQHALFTQDKMTALLVEKGQLQTEHLKIQLKELRNQMDPHFFFNSLNTLRSMVRQNHANSEQFIIGLSDFYRQMLKHQENTTLTLAEELGVLKSYLFLMKNRNEKALEVDLEKIDEKYDHHQIPTLALQSVVENCFKHNVMSSKRPLEIEIRTNGDYYIEVINNLQPKFSPQETSGLGLNLLKKRYQLLNIEEGVVIDHGENTFSVKLKLIPTQ